MKVDKPRSSLAWISYLFCVAQLLSCQINLSVLAASAASGKAADTLSLAGPAPALTPEKPVMAPVPSDQNSKKTASPPAAPSNANFIGPLKPNDPRANPPSTATAGTAPSAPATSTPAWAAPAPATGSELYPTVGRMEVLVFGDSRTQNQIEKRLSDLEQATFKEEYPKQTLFDRTQRLKATILGSMDEATVPDMLGTGLDALSRGLAPEPSKNTFLDDIASRPENEMEVDSTQIEKFALELVNYLRSEMGQGPLNSDPIATKVAQTHVLDLAKRNLVSHANLNGENPDLRYTKAGGADAITESIVSLKGQSALKKLTRAQVARLMKILLEREDDREALMSPDASAFGFSAAYMTDSPSVLGCLEIVTKHGAIEAVSEPINIGEKVEIKGALEGPYHFEKITLAWEGQNTSLATASDESQDALPYFPPLDYVAYASKAEHDYEKAIATLRTIGLIAAIAGGVFMPPVALAAPLIAMSGSTSEPKPMSDIPVHGGVKTDGSYFSARVPMSKEGKHGIYYVTVWASGGRSGKAIPISRRAFVVSPEASPVHVDVNEKSKHSDQAEL